MDRRAFLHYSYMTVLLGAFKTDFNAIAITPTSSGNPSRWGYIGAESPQHWSELSDNYRSCSIGGDQSPIDLQNPIPATLHDIDWNYLDSPLNILHNGHTVQINYESGSTLQFDNQRFELLQFHFHAPSEHQLNHHPFAMEMHLVHKAPQTNNLAVLSVFIKEGAEHPALQSIWQHMPSKETPEVAIPDVSINVSQLLPADRTHFYRYHGSLTTPPCSEGVDWIVLEQPIEASRQQIAQFKAAVGANARPIQPLNHRFLLFR